LRGFSWCCIASLMLGTRSLRIRAALRRIALFYSKICRTVECTVKKSAVAREWSWKRSLPSFVFLLWFPSKLPSNIGKHGKLAVPLHGYVLPTPSPTRFVALKLVCGRRFSACSASNMMKTNEFGFYLAITSWARSPRARRYFSQLSRARERTPSRRGLSWL
jgi:hypothetical protein